MGPMTSDEREPFDDVVCLFCNTPIEDEEALTVSLKAAWSESVASYWCHGRCLQEATHPAVPLYILSLSRDKAVFGSRRGRPLPT